ncbi:MAG: Gfo/Idh/MocA family oxidoreductase [Victivallaceae bacterium]|nr:Gfo/Idh/MocA family oxidoreductase [Victivallaceae bacterium]
MSEVLKKIVILGFGNRAQCYAREFRNSLGNKVQIVAVVDPDIQGAKKRLNALNISATVYSTPEAMIVAEKEIDGIIIATPDNCHLESFRAVAVLNKPILMEKPLEGNAGNFSELAPELLAYKAPILVGHCMRHAPIFKKAKALLDAEVIGKITSMRFVQNCHYGDVFFRGWHRKSEAITSLYLEKASHDFDIMHMMNGDNYAESVFAFSKRYKYGGDKPNELTCAECPEEVSCPESVLNQQATINGMAVTVERVGRNKCVWAQEADIGDDEMCMIEFSNGVQGSYIQTFYTPANYKGRVYTVIGENGVLDIDVGHHHGRISVHQRYATKGDSTNYDFDYLGRNHYNGDTYIVRNFLGIMQGTEQPFTTAAAAIAAENIGLAAVRSVKSRQLETVENS